MTTNQSPSKNKVGELRPSQILFSSGIGSIVDLPNLSTMVMGLDDWELTHASELGEARLLAAVQKEIGNQVKKLLTPPISQSNNLIPNLFDESAKVGIPVSPFPTWVVCPQCRLLAPLRAGLFALKTDRHRPDQNRYIHSNCRNFSPTAIPARFLVACQHGHL
jgi:hypothetical protein